MIVATAGFLYLIVFQFQGTLRHHGFLLIFLTGAFILSSFEKNQKWAEKIDWAPNVGRIIFSAVMILQFFKGLAVIQDELERNFSDSGNAARFIIDNGLDKYTIVGHRSYAASAVAAYLPNRKKIWYADQQRFGTFVYLDTVFFNNYLKYNADYAPYIVKEKFSKPDSILLLLNMPIQFPEFQRQWQLLYQTKEEPIKRDEIYFIYRYVYL
ncbi:MAG: hypothetical protein RMJ53_09150 [Chitinophagales bacterium]|nr:hypothetical protein [Chitinophagales bacterium]